MNCPCGSQCGQIASPQGLRCGNCRALLKMDVIPVALATPFEMGRVDLEYGGSAPSTEALLDAAKQQRPPAKKTKRK